MKKLYVVWDKVAQAIASAVLLYAADAAAVRGFSDALSDAQSPYAKHPADFELHCLGSLSELESGASLVPEVRVVLTGEQWANMQAPMGPKLAMEA